MNMGWLRKKIKGCFTYLAAACYFSDLYNLLKTYQYSWKHPHSWS